jgi:Flp pilus assembly pilin Flp
MNQKKQRLRRRRGQGITEYILIVSLIATATIGVATLFGNNIRTLFGMASNVLAGDDALANTAKHSSPQREVKTLKSFAQNNAAPDFGASGSA